MGEQKVSEAERNRSLWNNRLPAPDATASFNGTSSFAHSENLVGTPDTGRVHSMKMIRPQRGLFSMLGLSAVLNSARLGPAHPMVDAMVVGCEAMAYPVENRLSAARGSDFAVDGSDV